MEKQKLKELIVEHKSKALRKDPLIPREVLRDAEKMTSQKEVHIITGVRRCGKSTLLRLLMRHLIEEKGIGENNILYLNFEDERFMEFTPADFEALYEAYLELENPTGRKFFFLDEIQNIPAWQRWVNRLYEFEEIKFFVTGSNAALLSGEIATSLTGRNRVVELFPFSFQECVKRRGIDTSDKNLLKAGVRVELRRLFDSYLKSGGFPEVVKTDDTEILQEYFKDIIYRDIIIRHSIRNTRELRELALYLATNVSSIASYKKLKDLIGVRSLATVRNYLQYFEDAFLFFKVGLFDFSLKRQIYNPEKVYCIDHALASSVGFSFSLNRGKLLENIIFTELKRRGKEVYYWKSRRGREVDFVVKKGRAIESAIQVSFEIASEETRNREIRGLLEAHEELGVKEALVLTSDEETEETHGNLKISFVPAWKWMLQPLA